jgi:hypothetical protein
LDNVHGCEGVIAPVAWPDGVDLATVVADFCHTDSQLKHQDKRRHVVSRSWTMRMLSDAIKAWVLPRFKDTIPKLPILT